MAAPILHYFDFYGPGEVLRLLFVHSKTHFTDNRISLEEWRELNTPQFSEFRQLPVVEIDGLKLVQTLAILRCIGAKLGYVPTDPVLHYQVDSIIQLREEFRNAVSPFNHRKDVEGLAKYYTENAPRYLGFLETRLRQNQEGEGWFVGETVIIADIAVFQWLWDYFIREGRSQFSHYLDATPLLKVFIDRMITASPELKTYYETRPVSFF
jgi:glutathione S-transferase